MESWNLSSSFDLLVWNNNNVQGRRGGREQDKDKNNNNNMLLSFSTITITITISRDGGEGGSKTRTEEKTCNQDETE